MTNFDPASFLDATTQDALTRRPPIPAGTELVGIIGEPKPRQSQGKKDPTATFTFLDLPIELDLTQNPAIRQLIGQDKVTLTYGFMVDLSPSGGLDTSPGKNGRLRQLREALGMNTAGQAFNPRMLQGRQVRVKISHRINEMDGEVYDQVDGVAKG
jgi:hypothetical protein